MHLLYPPIKPYISHEIVVDATHVLYIEEVGNPKGKPIMVLHSGPGEGLDPILRRFFDPEIYRIILFDQRGCGNSNPHSSIEKNTTTHLLSDIQAIRDYLRITRFILCGGGWGSLLALLYAEQFPDQIAGLILYQIFLGREKDIKWFYQDGANSIFPDYWQEFIQFVPKSERQNPLPYYFNCLTSPNELIRMNAAKHWCLWRARCSSLHPSSSLLDKHTVPHFVLTMATIQSHFLKHHFFIEDNQILNNIKNISHLPTYLIHGRYDMICPFSGAWDLHKALPQSVLTIVREAGHFIGEPAMIDAIITVTKEVAGKGLDIC